MGKISMNDKLLMLSIKLKTLLSDDRGQDLIEYALVVALIAFGAVAGMGALAKDINDAFDTIGNVLTANVT